MSGDPIFTPSAVVILRECGDEQAMNRRGWGGRVKRCGNAERAETRKQADRQRREKSPRKDGESTGANRAVTQDLAVTVHALHRRVCGGSSN